MFPRYLKGAHENSRFSLPLKAIQYAVHQNILILSAIVLYGPWYTASPGAESPPVPQPGRDENKSFRTAMRYANAMLAKKSAIATISPGFVNEIWNALFDSASN